MKEKLIIKNFGPIKEVELDLGRFTILIGEQATGKSTVAKVLAMCRYFSYIAPSDIEPNSFYFNGLRDWGLFESLTADSYMSYDCYHYFLEVKTRIVKVPLYENDLPTQNLKDDPYFFPQIVPKSKEFKNLLIELDKIKADNRNGDFFEFLWQAPTSFYLNDVKGVMDNPFYLPTQRGLQSIFDIGQNSVRNLSSALFNQLSKMDGIARLFKKETYIEPLDIYYVNRNGHGFIRKANETEFYSLYNAASGYQSMIPIVLVVKYYTEIKRRRKSFFIEEAEQNLFPSAQNKLIHYLVDKVVSSGSSVLLTTQSPYILTSLINLMYAYQVGQENEEKVAKKIDKKYWLNPDDVSCYRMLADGTAESIIDDDGLIKAEKIDEISKVINKEFNDIMDIELGVDEAA